MRHQCESWERDLTRWILDEQRVWSTAQTCLSVPATSTASASRVHGEGRLAHSPRWIGAQWAQSAEVAVTRVFSHGL